jgi:hypothetical protein
MSEASQRDLTIRELHLPWAHLKNTLPLAQGKRPVDGNANVCSRAVRSRFSPRPLGSDTAAQSVRRPPVDGRKLAPIVAIGPARTGSAGDANRPADIGNGFASARTSGIHLPNRSARAIRGGSPKDFLTAGDRAATSPSLSPLAHPTASSVATLAVTLYDASSAANGTGEGSFARPIGTLEFDSIPADMPRFQRPSIATVGDVDLVSRSVPRAGMYRVP